MPRMLLLATLALACLAAPVLAAEVATTGTTAVVLPWGDWIVAIAQTLTAVLAPVLVTAILAAVLKTAPWLQLFLTQKRVEQMVQATLDYGLNSIEGAAKGKALSIDVGSRVLATATQRAIDAAPKKVTESLGGRAGVARAIFRAMHLDETANANNVLAPVIESLPRAGK